MESMMTLGTTFKFEIWALVFVIAFIVIGLILNKEFYLSLNNIAFWIWDIVFVSFVLFMVWVVTTGLISNKYTYVGTLEEKEIHNIVYTGKNQNGYYCLKFNYDDGSVVEVTEKEILCINGTSRIINYAVEVNTWLYDKVTDHSILALNYTDYINVVGNMDSLLQSENIIKLIKDRNLNVPGMHTEDNKKIDTESYKNTDVIKESNDNINDSMISELKNTINEKDEIIQNYSDRINKLTIDSENKDKEINKKNSEIEKLKNRNKVEFKSTDFVNICIGIGILVLVGMGVFLMIVYTKHKLAKIEMTLKSELKIREGVMLDKDLK